VARESICVATFVIVVLLELSARDTFDAVTPTTPTILSGITAVVDNIAAVFGSGNGR